MAENNLPVGNLLPNSNKYKEQQTALALKESTAPIATAKIKKGPLEKVGSSEAVLKEKTISEKLKDAFIADSVENVRDYLVDEKIVPELKEFMLELLFDGLSMLLGTKRRVRSDGKPDYSTISTGGSSYKYASSSNYYKRQPPVDQTRKNSTGNQEDDPCEILYKIGPDQTPKDAKATAEEVLSNLRDAAIEYDHASVADLYELSGISPKSFTDNDYGWTPELLRYAKLSRVREGYLLELPHPCAID